LLADGTCFASVLHYLGGPDSDTSGHHQYRGTLRYDAGCYATGKDATGGCGSGPTRSGARDRSATVDRLEDSKRCTERQDGKQGLVTSLTAGDRAFKIRTFPAGPKVSPDLACPQTPSILVRDRFAHLGAVKFAAQFSLLE
jgi:hypothetical protein